MPWSAEPEIDWTGREEQLGVGDVGNIFGNWRNKFDQFLQFF